MSRASAKFYFDDGDVLCGIYNGTSDYMCSFMSRDREEPWDWYYNRGKWADADDGAKYRECPHAGEHVLVYSDYGYGTYWHGLACRDCMIFKGPTEYGYPQYAESEDEYVPYFKDMKEAQAAKPALNP